MQTKFTQKKLLKYSLKLLAIAVIFMSFTQFSYSQVLFNEGFNVANPLPAGWAFQNNSNPIGTTNWDQGDPSVFDANSGAPDSYIFANFNNTSQTGSNVISNWLFAPVVTLTNGDIFTFYTRVPTGGGMFPDRLEVRMSTSGASTNVGATETSVGDFTNLLLTINPTLSATGYPETWTQFTLTLSGLAAPVSGRIAFRYYVTDAGFGGLNSNYIGIDDVVYTTFASVCTGTPTPGNTIATPASVCPGVPFSLSVQNSTGGSGVTYQWQSSPDNVTYTNIAGATLATLNTTLTAATYYRLLVTCASNTGTSTPIQVTLAPGSSCYCTAGATDVTTTFEKIDLVEFGTLTNASTSFAGYESFLNLTPVPSFEAGSTTPITITGNANTYAGDQVTVWIDYNHNGSFTDAGEIAYNSGLGAGPYTGNITIPLSALTGNTRMRIRLFDAIFGNGVNGPCGDNEYGQVEDYNINITPCIQVSITTQPADVTAACGGDVTLTFSAAGTGITYQWQQRDNATGAWVDLTNGPNYSGVNTASLSITAAPFSFDGYQYRIVFTGGCTATDASTEATLTVTQLVGTVTPASATICNGGVQLLSITNTAAAPTTVTVSSGPLTLAVPDNTENGVSTDLAVAGIPAGATISSMSVTLNMTHTYCGDMLFNLKAPNGSILALDKYLTGTGAQAGTYPNIGFANTVISSEGTAALGTAASQPITGVFRADAINTPIAGPTVQNPAGFVSDAPNFAALYSIPNGTWTLAMADGGPADIGTFTSWSINITYVSSQLATGVWSPAAGLFTDAGLTTAYDGVTPVNAVYAAPTTSTDYSVVVSTAVCSSDPVIIPVTVVNPIGTITQPADVNTCGGGNVSITADAATGGPATYQWQVSSNGGTSWTDITDGGLYSGATTNTLTITNVPFVLNNNQYRLVFTAAACSSTATSDAAVLTVNQNPAVSIAAAPSTSIYPGQQTVLTATLTPSGTATYQWFLNGDTIPGATSNTYIVGIDGLGEYSVTATSPAGCSSVSADAITINDSLNTTLFIYPNPNSGIFQVRFNDRNNGVTNPRTLTVYDSKGSRVFSTQYTINVPFGRMDVDMSKQPKGVYVIDLTDASGRRLQSERVIIF